MNNKGKARTYFLVIMGALILLSAVFFSTKLRGADRSEEQEKEYRLAKKSLNAADQSNEQWIDNVSLFFSEYLLESCTFISY